MMQANSRVKAHHFHSRKISTDRKVSKYISLLKVENFQLQNFFPRGKICVGQSHFTKLSFCETFSWVEMGLNRLIVYKIWKQLCGAESTSPREVWWRFWNLDHLKWHFQSLTRNPRRVLWLTVQRGEDQQLQTGKQILMVAAANNSSQDGWRLW